MLRIVVTFSKSEFTIKGGINTHLIRGILFTGCEQITTMTGVWLVRMANDVTFDIFHFERRLRCPRLFTLFADECPRISYRALQLLSVSNWTVIMHCYLLILHRVTDLWTGRVYVCWFQPWVSYNIVIINYNLRNCNCIFWIRITCNCNWRSCNWLYLG